MNLSGVAGNLPHDEEAQEVTGRVFGGPKKKQIGEVRVTDEPLQLIRVRQRPTVFEILLVSYGSPRSTTELSPTLSLQSSNPLFTRVDVSCFVVSTPIS